MATEQLFEDYDPDREDVFGSNRKVTPRRIEVTEKQKKDPLRKPKVLLGATLTAEKLPITLAKIRIRLAEESSDLKPEDYGFKTLEDLLVACSDTVIRRRTEAGEYLYSAKVNSANCDIMEFVQLQREGPEKNKQKSFLRTGTGTTGGGGYGSAFRKNPQVRLLGEDMSMRTNRGTAQQFQARNKLGPAKTVDRVRNLAEVLRSYRTEIGKSHPDEPQRIIVTLAALQQKFKDIYGLPAWGKLMAESDLHAALDQPEFSEILRFWKFREDGEVFIEELEDTPNFSTTGNSSQTTAAPPPPPPVVQSIPEQKPAEFPKKISIRETFERQSTAAPPQSVVRSIPERKLVEMPKNLTMATPIREAKAPAPINPRNNKSAAKSEDLESNNSFDNFSIADTTADSKMLLQEDKNDGFFESGPGFGGNRRVSQPPPPDQYSELYARFHGNGPSGTTGQPASQRNDALDISQDNQDLSFEINSAETSLDQHRPSSVVRPASGASHVSRTLANRRIDAAFAPSRSIIPRNPMKILADYIKSRGTVSFNALPDDDRVMVNFGANVFKVYATQPGDVLVRLVDADCDTSQLSFDAGKQLREPIEADLRWMWDQQVSQPPQGRVLVRPVMFIPPRGFLVVHDQDRGNTTVTEPKISRMEAILKAQMHEAPLQDLERKDIHPGMQAVYMYRSDGHDIRYYRILVIGTAHQNGEIMVLLVDHDDQYCVDVQISQLFPMPEKAGFKYYSPNVLFAALHGVHGMPEKEQRNMWKNADEEEHKSFVVGIFAGEQQRVLTLDMLWRNEVNELQWLSQIAKRRGAVVSTDMESAIHLTKNLQGALNGFGPDVIMRFVDYNREEEEEEKEEARVIPLDVEERDRTLTTRSTSVVVAPCSVAAAAAAVAAPTVTPQAALPLGPTSLNVYTAFDRALQDKKLTLLTNLVQLAHTMAEQLKDPEWEKAEKDLKAKGLRFGYHI